MQSSVSVFAKPSAGAGACTLQCGCLYLCTVLVVTLEPFPVAKLESYHSFTLDSCLPETTLKLLFGSPVVSAEGHRDDGCVE